MFLAVAVARDGDDLANSARVRWQGLLQSRRAVARMRGQFGGEVVRPAVVAAGDLHRCAVRWGYACGPWVSLRSTHGYSPASRCDAGLVGAAGARVLVGWVQTLARLATDARRVAAGRRWSHGRRRTKGHTGRPRSGAWWHGELEAGCGVVPLTGSHTNCCRCASRAASVCRTGWCAHLCQGVPDFLNHTH